MFIYPESCFGHHEYGLQYQTMQSVYISSFASACVKQHQYIRLKYAILPVRKGFNYKTQEGLTTYSIDTKQGGAFSNYVELSSC